MTGYGMESKQRTFRLWPDNRQLLESAEKFNLNVSEIVNEALARAGKQIVDAKVKKLREALGVSAN